MRPAAACRWSRLTATLYGTGMALSELEAARVKKVMDDFLARRRPPPDIRPQLDLGYRVLGQSVEIFEIRPVWRGLPGRMQEGAVAKATYVRTIDRWRVFWQRRDLKWHSYDPMPEVATIEDFVALVHEDAHACFFG